MTSKAPRRGDWTLPAVLVVVLGIGALGVWAQNPAIVGVNYDDGIYALLARSLAEGDGYRLTHLPTPVPGVKYPPVYPSALSLFWLLTDSPASALGAMKTASGICVGVAAGLFLLLLLRRRILVEPLAIVITLVAFASGFMMLISNGVLSEPLYLIILFAALLVGDDAEAELTTTRLIAVGLLAGLAALTRTVGITLVGAVAIAIAWRGGWRKALIALAPAFALTGLWALFTLSRSGQVPAALVPRYGSYLQLYLANVADAPGTVPEVALINIGAILQTAGANLVPRIPTELRSVAGVVIFAVAALGSRHAFRRTPMLVLYHWLYVGLIALWAFPPFRFLFALFPVTLALVAVAIQQASRRLAPGDETRQTGASRALRWAALGLVALFFANLVRGEVRAITRRVWDGAQLAKSAVSEEVVEWVNTNTSAEDVVAYEFDPLVALHTGRRAVPNNYEAVHVWYRSEPPQPELLARMFVEMGVDYLAVRRNVPAAAGPIDALMGRHPGGLRLVAATSHGALIFRTDLRALSLPAAMPGSARTPTGVAEE